MAEERCYFYQDLNDFLTKDSVHTKIFISKFFFQFVILIVYLICWSCLNRYNLKFLSRSILLNSIFLLNTIFVYFRILELTASQNSKVCMQSLRLLINLSTNEEMLTHLLENKVTKLSPGKTRPVWNSLHDIVLFDTNEKIDFCFQTYWKNIINNIGQTNGILWFVKIWTVLCIILYW